MVFIVGFLIGIGSSLPPTGPVSALVLRHILHGDGSRARWTGWGRVLPESAASALACVGISAAHLYAPWVQVGLGYVGAVALLFIALWFLSGRADPDLDAATSQNSPARDFITGLSLSGFNPTLLVTWPIVISMIAEAGLLAPSDGLETVLFSLSVGLGIFATYVVLDLVTERFRERLSNQFAKRTLRVIGVVLLVLAISFVVRTFI